jgi:hypothetical protein
MSGNTSWAAEAPAINDNACFESEDATSVNGAADNSEFYGGSLPRITGNSAALRRVLRLVRVVAPTDATVLNRAYRYGLMEELRGRQRRSDGM